MDQDDKAVYICDRIWAVAIFHITRHMSVEDSRLDILDPRSFHRNNSTELVFLILRIPFDILD